MSRSSCLHLLLTPLVWLCIISPLPAARPLAFDGGVATVTDLPPQSWDYSLVELPAQVNGEDVLGWEVRVKDWNGGDPVLLVRKDIVPDRLRSPYSRSDPWTGRAGSGEGGSEDRVLSLVMGDSLEPGTYYIGVLNDSDTEACTFTCQSRAVGKGMSLDVIDAAPGSEVGLAALAPREPAYIRYELDSPVPVWQFELDFGSSTPEGEGMLVLRKDMVPSSELGGTSHTPPYDLEYGVTKQTILRIEGQERLILFPPYEGMTVPAGTYYAMVVSEGNAPADTSQVGTGPVDFVLRNATSLSIHNVGVVELGETRRVAGSVPSGGTAFFHYRFAELHWPLEIRLVGVSGTSPQALVRPYEWHRYPLDARTYGLAGGSLLENSWSRPRTRRIEADSVLTLAPHTLEQHAITIRSASPETSGADYELEITQKIPRPMGFSSQLPNGPSTTQQFNLQDSQYAFFEVIVPPDVGGREFLGWSLELEMDSGSALVSAKQDEMPMSETWTYATPASDSLLYIGSDYYGERWVDGTRFGLGPVPFGPGIWYVQVQAVGDARGTITSEAIFAIEMAFDARSAVSGISSTTSGVLEAGEKAFYAVDVSETIDGLPVLGWAMQLEETSGNASVAVAADKLPISNSAYDRVTDGDDGLLLDVGEHPPGRYYIEVSTEEAAEFVLTSRAITAADLEHRWTMPARGETPSTPGVAAPEFGDSGVDANGDPLPGDQGIELAAGEFGFYAIEVPEENEGLLRIWLEDLDGDATLYLRCASLPSENGSWDYRIRSVFPREFANLVAPDGFYERQLAPGTYYAVVDGLNDSACRYRLRVSIALVQDLAMDGGSAAGVTVQDEDWRYFRFEVPLDLPENWKLTLSVLEGGVGVYLRDSVPPGLVLNGSLFRRQSWRNERKNQGIYPDEWVEVDESPIVLEFSAPQIRPGHTYYVGVEGGGDSVFSVTSEVVGGVRADPPLLDFYEGVVAGELGPGESRSFRIPVPADAYRWRHQATHSAAVSVYLEQGSFPGESSSDDWFSEFQSDSANNRLLGVEWPWVANESFYFTLVNTGATAEPFRLEMDGTTVLTDDSDGDLLPDQWERERVGTIVYGADSDDLDGDRLALLLEHFFGLDPRVADLPEMSASIVGDEYLLDFRKAASTPLVEYRVTRNSRPGVAPWTEAAATHELLSTDGETELWRARIPLDPGTDRDFFRIELNARP